jgi:hypothetical protein
MVSDDGIGRPAGIVGPVCGPGTGAFLHEGRRRRYPDAVGLFPGADRSRAKGNPAGSGSNRRGKRENNQPKQLDICRFYVGLSSLKGGRMAIEARRGCGFRKVGGLYMVCGGAALVCDRLPFPVGACPCCGAGIKYARGWTWFQPFKIFGGDHAFDGACECPGACPACYPSFHFGDEGRAGLIWVGEKFYSPEEFLTESRDLGVSRRVSAIPRGFKVGETWVFVAHIKGNPPKDALSDGTPGIFSAFRPTRIERIVKQSELDIFNKWSKRTVDDVVEGAEDITEREAEICDRLQRDVDRGFSLVPVPDNDPDHNPKGL